MLVPKYWLERNMDALKGSECIRMGRSSKWLSGVLSRSLEILAAGKEDMICLVLQTLLGAVRS